MTQPFQLHTERLVLRHLAPDDLDALHAVLGDAETMRYYPAPFSRDATRAWIERSIERYARDGHALFAVTLRGTGELIGDCGPARMEIDGRDEVELGWHIRRDHWNRGYATEAATAARDWAFDQLTQQRLVSLVRPENRASCRVAEKIGMTVEHDLVYKSLSHHLYVLIAVDRAPDAH
jgi:RimJ/RimL family protein N-acetyltransferase